MVRSSQKDFNSSDPLVPYHGILRLCFDAMVDASMKQASIDHMPFVGSTSSTLCTMPFQVPDLHTFLSETIVF